MLRSIQVDGFRSLLDCSINIEPGVNILVGPNGSGKTNIFQFLEFVSEIFELSVNGAINKSGGIGEVFSMSGKAGPCTTISAKFFGDGPRRNYSGERDNSKLSYQYEYEFSIVFSDTLDVVYFESQNLKFRSVPTSQNSDLLSNATEWDIHAKQSSTIEDNKIICSYEIEQLKIDRINGPIAGAYNRFDRQEEQSVRDLIISLLNNNRMNDPGKPIISFFEFLFTGIGEVTIDFSRNKTLNVVPGVAKRSEDSTIPSIINENGAGLTATLYALYQASSIFQPPATTDHSTLVPKENVTDSNSIPADNTFFEIVEYLKMVNEDVLDLWVEKDVLSNSATVFLSMKSQGGTFEMPMYLLSDGTVKWLALVTAIHGNSLVSAIEEPENFVHPSIQGEILNLLREIFTPQEGDEEEQKFVLVSTHSETLLNFAEPSEIIVVRMESGATRTRRPRNIQEVRDAIRETGFGLGYMYISGILENS